MTREIMMIFQRRQGKALVVRHWHTRQMRLEISPSSSRMSLVGKATAADPSVSSLIGNGASGVRPWHVTARSGVVIAIGGGSDERRRKP